MKNKYKKPLIIFSVLLILTLLISLFCAFLYNFSNQSLFFINGFGFKNNSSINVSLNSEYRISSNSDVNFSKVKINIYPNTNFKYELDELPCDFIELYDLDAYEKGEGKNINSAFDISKDDKSITFVKDKSLNEIIEFYKGDCDFPNSFSVNVDYYRCELTYEDEVISFTFGEELSGINFDNTEVIF